MNINITAGETDPNISAFWTAFLAHEEEWLSLDGRGKFDAINALAKPSWPHLAFEVFGQPEDVHCGLCISADGDVECFPLVMALVNQAPPLKYFTLHAFRSRDLVDFSMSMDDFTLNVSDVLIGHYAYRSRVGLEIRFARDIPDDCVNHARNMTFIMLDHVIGEYDLAVKVGPVEFVDVHSDAVRGTTMLTEFPAVFDKFWSQDLGHTGIYPVGEDSWESLEFTPRADDNQDDPGTAFVVRNCSAVAVAMRADLSCAVTLTMPASTGEQLNAATEAQQQIEHALASLQTGILAYTMWCAGKRQAVYYVNDRLGALAMVQQRLAGVSYEVQDEYDFRWSRYLRFETN